MIIEFPGTVVAPNGEATRQALYDLLNQWADATARGDGEEAERCLWLLCRKAGHGNIVAAFNDVHGRLAVMDE